MGTINSNDRIAETLYSLYCLRNISINTLHKGDYYCCCCCYIKQLPSCKCPSHGDTENIKAASSLLYVLFDSVTVTTTDLSR